MPWDTLRDIVYRIDICMDGFSKCLPDLVRHHTTLASASSTSSQTHRSVMLSEYWAMIYIKEMEGLRKLLTKLLERGPPNAERIYKSIVGMDMVIREMSFYLVANLLARQTNLSLHLFLDCGGPKDFCKWRDWLRANNFHHPPTTYFDDDDDENLDISRDIFLPLTLLDDMMELLIAVRTRDNLTNSSPLFRSKLIRIAAELSEAYYVFESILWAHNEFRRKIFLLDYVPKDFMPELQTPRSQQQHVVLLPGKDKKSLLQILSDSLSWMTADVEVIDEDLTYGWIRWWCSVVQPQSPDQLKDLRRIKAQLVALDNKMAHVSEKILENELVLHNAAERKLAAMLKQFSDAVKELHSQDVPPPYDPEFPEMGLQRFETREQHASHYRRQNGAQRARLQATEPQYQPQGGSGYNLNAKNVDSTCQIILGYNRSCEKETADVAEVDVGDPGPLPADSDFTELCNGAMAGSLLGTPRAIGTSSLDPTAARKHVEPVKTETDGKERSATAQSDGLQEIPRTTKELRKTRTQIDKSGTRIKTHITDENHDSSKDREDKLTSKLSINVAGNAKVGSVLSKKSHKGVVGSCSRDLEESTGDSAKDSWVEIASRGKLSKRKKKHLKRQNRQNVVMDNPTGGGNITAPSSSITVSPTGERQRIKIPLTQGMTATEQPEKIDDTLPPAEAFGTAHREDLPARRDAGDGLSFSNREKHILGPGVTVTEVLGRQGDGCASGKRIKRKRRRRRTTHFADMANEQERRNTKGEGGSQVGYVENAAVEASKEPSEDGDEAVESSSVGEQVYCKVEQAQYEIDGEDEHVKDFMQMLEEQRAEFINLLRCMARDKKDIERAGHTARGVRQRVHMRFYQDCSCKIRRDLQEQVFQQLYYIDMKLLELRDPGQDTMACKASQDLLAERLCAKDGGHLKYPRVESSIEDGAFPFFYSIVQRQIIEIQEHNPFIIFAEPMTTPSLFNKNFKKSAHRVTAV